MDWDRGLTRGRLVQGGARAALAGSLIGSVDLLARAGEALGAAAAPGDTRHYVSRPDLHPPKLTVVRRGKTADGSLFLAPSSGPGQRGVLIADEAGEPIWFHPTTPQTAMNFRTGVYHGKPVLTWTSSRPSTRPSRVTTPWNANSASRAAAKSTRWACMARPRPR